MRSKPACLLLALALAVGAAPASEPTGLECVIHEWAVAPGTWNGSGDTDPTPLLMTATTRWEFELEGCSLTAGTCDLFGSGSRSYQNGAERPEWYPTNTQPTITNPSGNTVVYDFSMRDAFVPISGAPRFEDLDWTLTAELLVPPSDSPSAAELASATSLAVSITHWVDNDFFVISWSGTASDTVFTSCTPVPAGLQVDDVAQVEGSGGGSGSFSFTVARSHNSDPVSVTVETVDGTAAAGSDFTAVTPSTLNFSAGGSLTQSVPVTVFAEDLVELDENFTVELSNPTNAILIDGVGDATITNDDAATLSIDNVVQAEGTGASTVPLVFTVTLDAQVDTSVSVDFDTVDDTAQDETGDGDYIASQGSLEFSGLSGQAETVTVQVTADNRPEQDESFLVELSNAAAGGRDVSIGVAQGVATLTDDDVACPTLAIYQQPFDSPAQTTGHPATPGGDMTFENVVDGGGNVTTLPPGPISGLRLWGLGSDNGAVCPLDPAIPFDIIFAVDAVNVPGAVVAERTNVLGQFAATIGDISRIDLEFEPVEGGSVSWISVQRAEVAGCAFLWLAEPLAGTYDDQVFTTSSLVPDDAYFCVGHPLLFRDGFESGDTSAWDNTIP